MKFKFISLNKKTIIIISCVCFFIISTSIIFKDSIIPTSVSKDQLAIDLKQMFLVRDKAALDKNVESVKYMFDTSVKIGTWAYEHEKKRTEYLKNWALIRNTKFTNMESEIIIQRVRDKNGSIWVDFLHSGKFTYVYPDKPDQPTSFGIGTRRTMEIVRKENGWIIKREWYLDPFEDVLEVPPELKDQAPQEINQNNAQTIAENDNIFEMEVEDVVTKNKKRYNREKAVAYADKYCGATFGSGNNYKYNKKYRDFTGLGGDCSNFTSQILSDATEGGGLKMDGSWHYSFGYKGVGGGSAPWVRALLLKDYLIYSGKAQLITRGTLKQVEEKTSKFPNGAYRQLQLADLVAYQDKKSIDHFSVITSFDPQGLPLVNSHTTDRYHVPWDLGWAGKDIKYWLLHVRD